MTQYFIDCGYTSVNHFGEELCGDRVEIVRKGGYTTLVLADGLGSGVKANILATLTSKIISTMLAENADMTECVETVVNTLPVCNERQVAYATFTVAHVDQNGRGVLFEFDNPAAVLMRDGKCHDLIRQELEMCGKKVYQSDLQLKLNDTLIFFSDGAVGAGAGNVVNANWKRDDIMRFLENCMDKNMTASAVACLLAGACNDLYIGEPSDDTSVAALRFTERKYASVLVGPPVDKDNDDYYVGRFLEGEGVKIVCGGTSAKIVARYLKKDIDENFDVVDKDVPPISAIDGIDLTTEGFLTLKKVKEASDAYVSHSDLGAKLFKGADGASRIMKYLFNDVTDIVFFVGQSVNSAHKGTEIDTTVKLKLIEAIARNLRAVGKSTRIIYD